MKPETHARIEQLSHLQWFMNIGKPFEGDVFLVKSWRDTIRHCETAEWESVQLQTNNLIGLRVSQIDYSRFQLWNTVAREIKAEVRPIIENHIMRIAVENNLPPRFQRSVLWDLLEICTETEYADIIPPLFFIQNILPVYQAGHFPCGWNGPKLDESWEGPMPPGKLFVY